MKGVLLFSSLQKELWETKDWPAYLTFIGVGLGMHFLNFINAWFPIHGPGAANLITVPNELDPANHTPAKVAARHNAQSQALEANNQVFALRAEYAAETSRAVRGVIKVIKEMRPPPRPVQPALTLELPDYYKADHTQVANWV